MSKTLLHYALRGNGSSSQAASRRVPSCVEAIDAAAFGIARHALMNADRLMT